MHVNHTAPAESESNRFARFAHKGKEGRTNPAASGAHLLQGKSKANRASYRMESKGKRGFPRPFRGLRNLQCQENGAPTQAAHRLEYVMITMIYERTQVVC